MNRNDDDLIMQFARGAEALTLIEKLDSIDRQFTAAKAQQDALYSSAMERLRDQYMGQIFGALRETRNRLDDLSLDAITTSDDGDDDD